VNKKSLKSPLHLQCHRCVHCVVRKLSILMKKLLYWAI